MTGAALRGDEADLFRTHHRALRRAVAHRVIGPDALVEDACGHAWQQLLIHQPRRDTVFGWLYVVALHEAFRLSRQSPPGPSTEDPVDELADTGALVEDLDRLAALSKRLPARRLRLIGLQAAGFTYREIAAITGDSTRTVERQLLRARHTARHLGDAD